MPMPPHLPHLPPARRKSTLAWSRKHAAHMGKIAEALDMPMVADVLHTMDERRNTIFAILAPVQVFKSLVGQLRLCRSWMIAPTRSLWYCRTDDQCKAFADEKLTPLVDQLPVLRPLFFADTNKRTRSRINFPGDGHFSLLSANVQLNRNSRSTQEIYCDETWDFDSAWITEIRDRRASYKDGWNEIHMSTGADAGHELDLVWQASDQRERYGRCPSCHRLFRWEFGSRDKPGGIRYDAAAPELRLPDGRLNEDFIRATVRYECPHCATQHAYSPALQAEMDRRGMWVMENPAPARDVVSWHIHELALRDWADHTINWIKANDAKNRGDLSLLENMVRKRFARTWSPADHYKEKKSRPTGPSPYKLGEKWPGISVDPEGNAWLICTVDVQIDHFVLVIRGWNIRSVSRLVWCEKVTSPGRIADLCREHGVLSERTFLDGRHDPDYVRRIAAQFGWRVLIGEADKDYLHPHDRLRRIYSPPRAIDAYTGTGYEGSQRGVVLQWNFSKQSALSRLHNLRTLTTAEGEPLWTAAENAPDWYWKESEAHHRVRKERERDGFVYYEWHGFKDDHAGDCEAMQVVVASMCGLTGAESIDTPPPTQPSNTAAS